MRLLIGKYLEINPAEISFQYSEFGKPGIANNNSLQFNISHSQNIALFAFTKKFNIGVDVEFVNPDIEVKEIAENFFSTNEIRIYLPYLREQQTLGFFNCWTRKEAFIKAVGEGLSFPLDKFEVSLEPNKPAKLLATQLGAGRCFKMVYLFNVTRAELRWKFSQLRVLVKKNCNISLLEPWTMSKIVI